ncbi:MAG: transcription-repair coupling factor, partial [Nannocystaceae bacterium]
ALARDLGNTPASDAHPGWMEDRARALAADVALFRGLPGRAGVGGPVVLVPEIDISPYGDAAADPRVLALRLAALARLGQPPSAGGPELVIVSLRSLMRKVMPPTGFFERCVTWKKDQELVRDDAVGWLVRAGYTRVDVVEDPGTFAVRGGVLDVFPGLVRDPARIELFGDDIDRIRLFDPDSQRSLREVETLTLHPARETIHTASEPLRTRILQLADQIEVPSSKTRLVLENLQNGVDFFGIEALTPLFHDGMGTLVDYLPEKSRYFVDAPETLAEFGEQVYDEWAEQCARRVDARELVAPVESFLWHPEELAKWLTRRPVVGQSLELYDPEKSDPRAVIRFELQHNQVLKAAMEAARGQRGGELLRPLVDCIRSLRRPPGATVTDEDVALSPPWAVVLLAPNQTHAERLASLLHGYGLAPELGEGPNSLQLQPPTSDETRVQVIPGSLGAGFCSPEDRLLVVSEGEIYGAVRKPRRARARTGLSSLSQLGVGDYIVHITHGVGRYLGLRKLDVSGMGGDYVQLEYAGRDKLYLPVYRLHEIERFVAAHDKAPKLDRMGGVTFATKTRKVKQAVRQMADELLQIYAAREAAQGVAYPPVDEMYMQFEGTFPFEETPDQLTAIEAVQNDLSAPRPMDRLICGDVGFGKTEVALRAAFRVASAGKQVAILAPTTVLVQQHYLTFSERMARFPLRIACLNRFQSAARTRQIIADAKAGAIDILIGTHRLLSRDIRFADLGLLVIDEEQRFGVAQKTRFKKFKSKVDVLTLTATPIPRTLHMSLLGLREICMIMTPPVDRLAVRTYLTRSSDAVLFEGISRELARGGQVFYVVPRILGMQEHANRIRALLPQARVLVAHGQMPGELLEKAMVDFVEHRADVLVSTNIIESGLDIPRANTMFIARADLFGLAQLHQLRGRVGRSRLRAHCYLMVRSLERLSADAKKRMEAMQRHSELGAGFNVASEDLEIRGAGDLLGARQSGQIHAIGYEAYARILGEAVAELRGEPIVHETDPEMVFDAPAFLPEDYVEDVGQRLDFYRRLSAAHEVEEVEDVMAELGDRYGEPPLAALHLGMWMQCKVHGRRLRALALELKGRTLSIRLGEETTLSSDVVIDAVRSAKGGMKLTGERLRIRLPEVTGDDRHKQLRAALKALRDLVFRVVAG